MESDEVIGFKGATSRSDCAVPTVRLRFCRPVFLTHFHCFGQED